MTDAASSDRLRLVGRGAIVLETIEDLDRFSVALGKLDGEDLKAALRETLKNEDPYYYQQTIGAFLNNTIGYIVSRSPVAQGVLLFEILKARYRESAPSGRVRGEPCDCVHPVTSSFLGAVQGCPVCGGTGRVKPKSLPVSAGRGRIVLEKLRAAIDEQHAFKGDRQGLVDLVAYVEQIVREKSATEDLLAARELDLGRMNARTCNEGHENNLPAHLWDCPKCGEERLKKIVELEARVEELERELEDQRISELESNEQSE